MKAIAKKEVTGSARGKFLVNHFGRHFMRADNMMFNFSKRHLVGFEGAYWHFYELDNGGFLIVPDFKDQMKLVIPSNYTDMQVDAETYGTILTLYVINMCISLEYPPGSRGKNTKLQETLIDKMDFVKDYAATLEHSQKVFSAID